MLKLTYSARCNHRYRNRITDSPGQPQIKPDFGAITVHAGQQQFPCPHLHHLSRPFNRIQPGGLATAMGKDFPAWFFTVSTDALGVYGHHDALAAETVSGFPHEVRVEYRRGV